MASLCDTCSDPGHCCRAMPINHGFRRDWRRADVRQWMVDNNMPFEPLRWAPAGTWPEYQAGLAADQTIWLFSCPKLGADGRCTIYDARPRTCQIYEPGMDEMCVHYRSPYAIQAALEMAK